MTQTHVATNITFCGCAESDNSTLSLSSLHVQDVLWHRKPYFKSQWKRWEGCGGMGSLGAVMVNHKAGQAPSVSRLMLLFFSLSAPLPSNLFACLCQCRLRSSCSAHSELTDPASPGKNISLCHPPRLLSELCNLSLLCFQLEKNISLCSMLRVLSRLVCSLMVQHLDLFRTACSVIKVILGEIILYLTIFLLGSFNVLLHK